MVILPSFPLSPCQPLRQLSALQLSGGVPFDRQLREPRQGTILLHYVDDDGELVLADANFRGLVLGCIDAKFCK